MSEFDVVRQSGLGALRRLAPYVRPVRGRLFGSGLAALGAMLAGLAIPLVIQRIVDGPIAEGCRWPSTTAGRRGSCCPARSAI
ncbi:MAG: hypothetical protein ACRDTG_10790 [Pseudonocardiaceae bacterium]